MSEGYNATERTENPAEFVRDLKSTMEMTFNTKVNIEIRPRDNISPALSVILDTVGGQLAYYWIWDKTTPPISEILKIFAYDIGFRAHTIIWGEKMDADEDYAFSQITEFEYAIDYIKNPTEKIKRYHAMKHKL